MICKNDPISARFYMLGIALGLDDSRPPLQHIFCDGQKIVSTNGKMMVYTDNCEKLKPGFYDLGTAGTGRDKKTVFLPVTDEKAKSWHYPDWKRIVPVCTGGKTVTFNTGSKTLELEIFQLQFTLASFGVGSLIPQKYINLLCTTQLSYTVHMINGLSPMIFELPGIFTMLVMPKFSSDREHNPVNALFDSYKADVIAAEKTTPKVTIEAEPVPAPETPAPEAVQQSESPEPPAPAAEPETTAEPVPEPAPAPKAKAKSKAKAPKQRKPAFQYICTLKNRKQLTLDSIAAVRARKDVTHCQIEPIPRKRKTA